MVQERTLVITHLNIYNFKKKSVKRIIKIQNLAGMTKSTHVGSTEFVIHVKKEHDYRMKSKEHRNEIFNTLKMAYISIMKMNLPIYAVKCKQLKDFSTTEKDVIKGITRKPLDFNRLSEEDVDGMEGELTFVASPKNSNFLP